MRPAKLKDVAGVSATTVSRFMNGQIRLPEATERRIMQPTERTAYQPNLHARRLSMGRSDAIGLVVPDIANPFFARLAAPVEAEADARGLQVSLFVTLNRPGRERDYLGALTRNQVDGMIFATNHGDHAELGPMRVGSWSSTRTCRGSRRRGSFATTSRAAVRRGSISPAWDMSAPPVSGRAPR